MKGKRGRKYTHRDQEKKHPINQGERRKREDENEGERKREKG